MRAYETRFLVRIRGPGTEMWATPHEWDHPPAPECAHNRPVMGDPAGERIGADRPSPRTSRAATPGARADRTGSRSARRHSDRGRNGRTRANDSSAGSISRPVGGTMEVAGGCERQQVPRPVVRFRPKV
ncbi:hypothetical protein GCM10028832_16270 [Streptomyces sparsus]